ncbi:uncharacterized protein NEMAJ01_2111 [Nematocida major]|uniref:uncharacterized protein n=1 Tax=Nematocida major TaxID=1912982 RepID=UPI002007801F|nr:uncharacterized protein NEMAJ01_2111 [Nematocida major]KAH9387215.1 hypothetical protein NEMAJ01_2111 [Nematocida major]
MRIFMSVGQEYSALIRKSKLTNKYIIKALKTVAETNNYYAREIVKTIQEEISAASDENKDALLSLLRLLAQNPAYFFIEEGKTPHKKQKHIESVPVKKRKVQVEVEVNIEFMPYPPEYFLFKLVSKQAYAESYAYYTEGKEKKSLEAELEPQLTREYLATPHLEQAYKLLYTAATQCKVCGMRFDVLSLYKAHAEMHQKKSQIGRSVEAPMWRSWLQETGAMQEQKVPVKLKASVQEKMPTVPVRGDREQKCTICGDAFEVIWSDESECWSFNDALVIRTSPRQISHRRCVS